MRNSYFFKDITCITIWIVFEDFLKNSFADLVSLSSNSIEFHIFGNKAEGKYSSVLKRTSSSLHDFVQFGSAKESNISWKEVGRFYTSIYA